MLPRRFLLGVSLALLVLGAVACGGGTGGPPTSMPSEPVPMQPNPMLDDSNAVPGNVGQQGQGGGSIVEATPMSQEELEAQPPGSSGAGAGAGGGEVPPNPGPTPMSGPMLTYSDDAYSFSVEYPADFTIRAQPEAKRKELNPVPEAVYLFMNPTLANSQVPDEPGDLTVRVYAAGNAAKVEDWLTANQLAQGAQVTSFETPNAAGVEVCAGTMIGPGCAYYFFGNGWVYQLTASSLTGEAMVQTFKMLS